MSLSLNEMVTFLWDLAEHLGTDESQALIEIADFIQKVKDDE